MALTRTRITRRLLTLTRPDATLYAALALMAAMLLAMGWVVQGQVNRAAAADKARFLAAEAQYTCARSGSLQARNDCVQAVATRQAGGRDASTALRLSLPIA